MFQIQVGAQGAVKFLGRLDASAAEQAHATLRALAGPMTADFSELEYISSAGLGLMIETHKRLASQGHGLRIINTTPRVRNIFAYAGLDKLLRVE
ncbi:MAG TPA: STAS domain-containing protein [Candidatus Eisenbacteria bacterium]|jgi:anti-sigma B factor antagonist